MLCEENIASKKSIVCSVKVFRLKFVSLPNVDQLQPNFHKLPCVEQRIAKLDWKSTVYSIVKCPWIFIFILLCLMFSQFSILPGVHCSCTCFCHSHKELLCKKNSVEEDPICYRLEKTCIVCTVNEVTLVIVFACLSCLLTTEKL